MVDVTGDCGPMVREACKRGNLAFLTRIIDENKGSKDLLKNLDDTDGLGNCALHYSAQAAHLETLQLLADSGANPNVQNHAGDTPLHKAVAKDFKEGIRVLCEAGADANVKNRKNLAPLQMVRSQEVRSMIKNISIAQKEAEQFDDDDMVCDSDDEL